MHFVWAMVLITFTVFLFSLPLWPAIWELRSKNKRTLPIDRSDDGSAAYAASFRQGVQPADISTHVLLNAGSRSYDVVCASQNIYVQPDCQFNWLDAKTIEFVSLNLDALESNPKPDAVPQPLEGVREKFQRILGDAQTKLAGQIQGDFVVTQDVIVAQDSVVLGNIKAYGNVRVCPGAVVHGSVFANQDIVLESGAVVFGVVSAGQQISLWGGSIVGHTTQLSSVTAPVVLAYAGARVHGSVKAPKLGHSQP